MEFGIRRYQHFEVMSDDEFNELVKIINIKNYIIGVRAKKGAVLCGQENLSRPMQKIF